MSKNVWEVLLDILEKCSNRQIFGVFGDAVNPLADALRVDKGKRFEWIGVRHEEVAAFAAGAQARLTGKLGLCAGTVGPGAIHLLNGLYDAKMDRAPVLAMTGQIPRPEIGTDYHQEVNLDRLFDDVCVYNQTVIIPEQMPRLGILAAQTALARSGVAHLSIPTDVGPLKDITTSLQHPVFQQNSTISPCAASLDRVATHLNASKKITILIGWGSRGATHEVLELAKKLKAPIAHSLKGKAIIPQDNPYWCGGIGMLGSTSGMHALDTCDTLIMLGTDFPYRQFYPKGKEIIQVDIAPERLGKRCAVKEGIVGDVKATIEALLPLIEEKTDSKHLESTQHKRANWDKTMVKRAGRTSHPGRIHPQTVAHLVDKYASDDAVFTADTGETIIWMARQVHMKGGRDFIASFNHATMANAFSQAIGIQLLDKSRQVVAMCGDGGFSMLMGDFITAVTYKLPIKVVVFNNSRLGLVKMEMEANGFPEWGIHLHNPSFADCAKAMGGSGIRVEDPNDLDNAMKRAFEMDGPVVVDVLTNPDELIMPPKLMPAKAWGYSISKMRELWSESE
jgi:pyruvate dehydrogenase (quinone)